MSWTDERVETLKAMWAEGKSASQIAKELGGVTRNAVIGKVHRLGLSNRVGGDRPEDDDLILDSAGEEPGPEPEEEAARTAPAAAPGRPAPKEPAQAPRPRAPGQPLPPQPPGAEISPEALANLAEVAKKARRLSLMQLTERTCKWPIGDPATDDFWFCGLPAVPGKPYCETHVAVAFQPMSARRDRRAGGRYPPVAPTGVLDVATVVYARELPVLRLQACSMARFLDPAGIRRVIVIVNDIDEADCAARVEAMRPAWGPLAPRLEVVGAEAVFALRPNGPRGLRQRLRLWFTRNRRRYPLGVKGGWRGNRGWSVQQALKLAVARLGDSPMILLLDAKNHFVRPVGLASFVAADGRPLSYLAVPGAKRRLWIEGSFRLLGLPPPNTSVPSPPTVTPVVVPRAVLRGCLDAVEARQGPIEAFFARAKGDLSEFMLIYAYVAGHCGGWDAVFAPGLVPAATIHRRGDPAHVDQMLTRVEDGSAEILSVHNSRLGNLAPEHRARIEAIWRERRLPGEGLLTPESARERAAPGWRFNSNKISSD